MKMSIHVILNLEIFDNVVINFNFLKFKIKYL